jgi:hypothetical protein
MAVGHRPLTLFQRKREGLSKHRRINHDQEKSRSRICCVKLDHSGDGKSESEPGCLPEALAIVWTMIVSSEA